VLWMKLELMGCIAIFIRVSISLLGLCLIHYKLCLIHWKKIFQKSLLLSYPYYSGVNTKYFSSNMTKFCLCNKYASNYAKWVLKARFMSIKTDKYEKRNEWFKYNFGCIWTLIFDGLKVNVYLSQPNELNETNFRILLIKSYEFFTLAYIDSS
jgi:hypothetical protein